MKTILALSAAAAVFTMAGAANAQECINGYRMLKDQIPVTCDSGPGSAGFFATAPEQAEEALPAQPIVEEPLYTGSIATETSGFDEPEGLPGSDWQFVDRKDCQPGQYWMLELESGDRPVAC